MASKTNKTIVVTITEDMHRELARLAPQHGATVAGLTRAVLARWLEEQGVTVDWVLPWGGRRTSPKPDATPPDGE